MREQHTIIAPGVSFVRNYWCFLRVYVPLYCGGIAVSVLALRMLFYTQQTLEISLYTYAAAALKCSREQSPPPNTQ